MRAKAKASRLLSANMPRHGLSVEQLRNLARAGAESTLKRLRAESSPSSGPFLN
jgi:hypothetical protein